MYNRYGQLYDLTKRTGIINYRGQYKHTLRPSPEALFIIYGYGGLFTTGGAGGTVIPVTTLANSGAGSLRTALTTAGPRIIIFTVSGYIVLGSQIEVTDGDFTILGQTAPNGGIGIRNDPASLILAPIRFSCSNFIVQHLRFRIDPHPTNSGSSLDGVSMGEGTDGCFDHCSIMGGVDGCLDLFSNPGPLKRVTVQNSIIAWGLDNSTHFDEGAPSAAPHSTGSLISATAGSSNVIGDISYVRNIFAHNRSRNPFVELSEGHYQFINNVIWDNGADVGMSVRDDLGGYNPRVYLVGNYHVGDNVNRGYYARSNTGSASAGVWWVRGNYTPWHVDPDAADELTGVLDLGDHGEVETDFVTFVNGNTFPTVPELHAFDAYDYVLENAGAKLPKRDTLDARIITNITGEIEEVIDNLSEVGGYPDLTI